MMQFTVGFLKSDPRARYQGYMFYFKEGFCWTDINTTFLKCRQKQASVNDVKSMSLYSITDTVPEYYIVCLINSNFMSYYVDDFVNNTQTFQINEARQLPIIIPTKQLLKEFENLFNAAIEIRKSQLSKVTKLTEIQNKLDKMVFELYSIV